MAKVTLKTLEQIEKTMGIEGMNVVRGFCQNIFNAVLHNNCHTDSDWKGPINAIIRESGCDADLDTIRHAVVYFTGNPDCKVTEADGEITVITKGYRAGPCGG